MADDLLPEKAEARPQSVTPLHPEPGRDAPGNTDAASKAKERREGRMGAQRVLPALLHLLILPALLSSDQ